MVDRESIEQQIRQVLATETRAIPLSNKLFRQDGGLFGQLATTEEERRMVAQSSLFKEAQRRLTELRRREAEEFSRAVDQGASKHVKPRLCVQARGAAKVLTLASDTHQNQYRNPTTGPCKSTRPICR
jgi:hypothetical protein